LLGQRPLHQLDFSLLFLLQSDRLLISHFLLHSMGDGRVQCFFQLYEGVFLLLSQFTCYLQCLHDVVLPLVEHFLQRAHLILLFDELAAHLHEDQ